MPKKQQRHRVAGEKRVRLSARALRAAGYRIVTVPAYVEQPDGTFVRNSDLDKTRSLAEVLAADKRR